MSQAAYTVYNPNDDGDSLLIINLTEEGLIIDVYDAEGVDLLRTWCATADEIAESLLSEVSSALVLTDPAYDV